MRTGHLKNTYKFIRNNPNFTQKIPIIFRF
jgi:hypothetical protein